MTPEEIAVDLNTHNRTMLYGRQDYLRLTPEEVLALMDNAAMHGFKLGSNLALSMVRGALAVQLARVAGRQKDTPA